MPCDTYSIECFGGTEVILEEGTPIMIRQPYTSSDDDLDDALDWLSMRYPSLGISAREIPGAVMWTIFLDAFVRVDATV
jgi:hypothetical protein